MVGVELSRFSCSDCLTCRKKMRVDLQSYRRGEIRLQRLDMHAIIYSQHARYTFMLLWKLTYNIFINIYIYIYLCIYTA